jgi:hypothetical protein
MTRNIYVCDHESCKHSHEKCTLLSRSVQQPLQLRQHLLYVSFPPVINASTHLVLLLDLHHTPYHGYTQG